MSVLRRALGLAVTGAPAQPSPIRLHAAGSLREAFVEISSGSASACSDGAAGELTDDLSPAVRMAGTGDTSPALRAG